MLLLKITTNGLECFPFHVIEIHASLIQYPTCFSESYFVEELCFCITYICLTSVCISRDGMCLRWNDFNFIMYYIWYDNIMYEICFPYWQKPCWYSSHLTLCGLTKKSRTKMVMIRCILFLHIALCWTSQGCWRILHCPCIKLQSMALNYFPFYVTDFHASLIQYPIYPIVMRGYAFAQPVSHICTPIKGLNMSPLR